jgi:hypothetical protein
MPPLRQAAGTLAASGESAVDKDVNIITMNLMILK